MGARTFNVMTRARTDGPLKYEWTVFWVWAAGRRRRRRKGFMPARRIHIYGVWVEFGFGFPWEEDAKVGGKRNMENKIKRGAWQLEEEKPSLWRRKKKKSFGGTLARDEARGHEARLDSVAPASSVGFRIVLLFGVRAGSGGYEHEKGRHPGIFRDLEFWLARGRNVVSKGVSGRIHAIDGVKKSGEEFVPQAWPLLMRRWRTKVP
ncbi:hypothetical protein F5I97DRAFT_1828538 [Phlebopus sp. FC_14]|nr:hypothetical protein F5I97DRAFT_1828538 [Phlebopus sp. FC_14]